jgi:hypothetical protein
MCLACVDLCSRGGRLQVGLHEMGRWECTNDCMVKCVEDEMKRDGDELLLKYPSNALLAPSLAATIPGDNCRFFYL